VGARVDGLGGTTTTVRCFEDNALAKFVLDGGGKGYVRRSTAAAPATPTPHGRPDRHDRRRSAGRVFCSDDDILRGITWGEAQPFAVYPMCAPSVRLRRIRCCHMHMSHAMLARGQIEAMPPQQEGQGFESP
jgi:hypothetical protein